MERHFELGWTAGREEAAFPMPIIQGAVMKALFRALAVLAAVASCVLSPPTSARSYPGKPVRIVNPKKVD